MSCVCDTILKIGTLESEQERLIEVNSYFEDQKGFVLLDCDSLPESAKHWYGGSKVFQTTIAIGAFNYLGVEEFKEHLKNNVRWEFPDEMQLIYCNEDDDNFQIWGIKKQ